MLYGGVCHCGGNLILYKNDSYGQPPYLFVKCGSCWRKSEGFILYGAEKSALDSWYEKHGKPYQNNDTEFRHLVKAMRSAQEADSKNGDRSWFRAARKLEEQVDEFLKKMEEG